MNNQLHINSIIEITKNYFNSFKQEIVLNETILNPTVEIEFINNVNRVVLNFYYRMYGNASIKNQIDYVVFSIENKERKEHFTISDYWFEKKATSENIKVLGQISGENFETRLHTYFQLVKTTLETDLKEVIDGKKWIDVPMDWGPYK